MDFTIVFVPDPQHTVSTSPFYQENFVKPFFKFACLLKERNIYISYYYIILDFCWFIV